MICFETRNEWKHTHTSHCAFKQFEFCAHSSADYNADVVKVAAGEGSLNGAETVMALEEH